MAGGASLAPRRWSLPDVLQDAVGFHHSPRHATKDQRLAALIGYADQVVRNLKLGNGGGEPPALNEEFEVVLPLGEFSIEQLSEDLSKVIPEQLGALSNW